MCNMKYHFYRNIYNIYNIRVKKFIFEIYGCNGTSSSYYRLFSCEKCV